MLLSSCSSLVDDENELTSFLQVLQESVEKKFIQLELLIPISPSLFLVPLPFFPRNSSDQFLNCSPLPPPVNKMILFAHCDCKIPLWRFYTHSLAYSPLSLSQSPLNMYGFFILVTHVRGSLSLSSVIFDLDNLFLSLSPFLLHTYTLQTHTHSTPHIANLAKTLAKAMHYKHLQPSKWSHDFFKYKTNPFPFMNLPTSPSFFGHF